jgi:hypothetical protein
MKSILLAAFFAVLTTGPSICAQTDSLRDTTKAAVPAVLGDSAQQAAPNLDSLRGPRVKITGALEPPKPIRKRIPRYSYFDTLATYFASPRLNQREMLDESSYHDAGDYFRFDPSYVVRDFQDTPMRKTVQPYGLSGDRLNTILNDVPVHPFEHVLEPDGMIDMNDLPTASDRGVYVLPGAAGMVFGGRNATASLFTRPTRPQTVDPQSALLVEKGSLGFANTRGRYSKMFTDGRLMDLSIGYRRAPGSIAIAGDDSYHYDGNVYWPTGEHQALNLTGHLYDRDGSYTFQPDVAGTSAGYARHRLDRSAKVGYEFRDGDRPCVWETGFTYLRQGSDLGSTPTGGDYYGRFNLAGRGLYLQRDVQTNSAIVRAALAGDHLNYEDGHEEHSRSALDGSLTYSLPFQATRLASKFGIRWSQSFGFMPQAALVAQREAERFYALASVGLAQREPSLHERYLREQTVPLYVSSSYQYDDVGNPDLKKETQLTASLVVELGKIGNALRLELTGGKILDGIDWLAAKVVDSVSKLRFSPVNEDVSFATITANKSISFGSFFKLHSGGSYHYVKYAQDKSRPYQPDYNAFGGAELHYYWKPKLIDLWAYGEAVYVGPYDGYFESNLGNCVVLNAKLSFRMAHFRCGFAWRNLLDLFYQTRDNFTVQGRQFGFNFNWEFSD